METLKTIEDDLSMDHLPEILSGRTLDDLLRIGLMIAIRDEKKSTAYFLEMALLENEQES